MSWVKEANKIGEYNKTYIGFRIYLTVEGTMNEREETREGTDYVITEFTPPLFVAIDKTGLRFEGRLEDVCSKIDKEDLRRYFSRKEGVEMEFRPSTPNKPLQP